MKLPKIVVNLLSAKNFSIYVGVHVGVSITHKIMDQPNQHQKIMDQYNIQNQKIIMDQFNIQNQKIMDQVGIQHQKTVGSETTGERQIELTSQTGQHLQARQGS